MRKCQSIVTSYLRAVRRKTDFRQVLSDRHTDDRTGPREDEAQSFAISGYYPDQRRNRRTAGHPDTIQQQAHLFDTRAVMWVATVTNPTTVTELSGMRMAAINGVRCPLTAKETPVML